MEDLVQKFHNLNGITVFERQRSFSRYLTEISKTSHGDKKQLVKLLKPTNRLEDVFYTTMLLEFEENEELLNILYSNDIQLRKMVLDSDAFVKDAYEIIVVNDFSSEVCFVVRLRILIRLGEILQDDDRLDHYYHAMMKKYGLHLAKNLLPGCKLETIAEEMKRNRVLFNNKQLTKIYERFPDFLESYFDHLVVNNYKQLGTFDKLIRYIALTNVDLYWKLLNKFDLKTKLSQTSTIKLMIKHCEEVLQRGEKYIGILQKNAAFRFLPIEKFKILYSKLFPQYLKDLTRELFNGNDKEIIKCLKKRIPSGLQFTILNDVFNSLYNSDLLHHYELFTEELLGIVPANRREEIIDRRMEEDKNDDWLCFYELEKAHTILRERISITSDSNKRRHFVFSLVKACAVNKNIPSLLEVLKFVNDRHRNEDSALFRRIFEFLTKFNLKKFEGEHWEQINRMIKIYLITQHNKFDYSDSMLNSYFEGYFGYRIRENLPIDDEVLKYLKLYYKDYHLMLFREKKDKKQHKMLLNMFIEMIPNTFTDNCLRHACSFYLQSIVDYNKENPEDIQDLTKHDFIIKYIYDVMDDEIDDDLFRIYIFKGINNLKGNEKVYKKVADTLWSSSPERDDLQWIYFLKKDPQYCVHYYEKFFQHSWTNTETKGYEHLVQYYTHLGLPQLYQNKAKEYLSEDHLNGHPYSFEVSMRFLVYSDDFLEVIDKFLPKEDYDYPSEEENVNLISTKKTLGAILGQFKNLERIFKPLIRLSKSDYLKFCVQSIYKVVYNLPENKLTVFMDDILIGQDSLRKHTVFITAVISDQEKVYKTLKTIGQVEEIYTLRKYLLKSTIHYFFLNPSDEFFELVKDHCGLLNVRDPEGYDMWLKFDKIPVQYLVKYVEFLWKLTQDNDYEEVRNLKYKILEKLDEDLMKHFNREFLNQLVKKCVNFEWEDTEKKYAVLYRYIISGNLENILERIDVITSQFPKDVYENNCAQISKNLLKFTIGFCENIFREQKKCNYDSKNILEHYQRAWEEIYSIENNFEQYSYLKLTEFYCQDEFKYDLDQLIENVTAYLSEIIETFGSYIIPNFANIFAKYFSSLMRIEERQIEEELFKFLLEFLEKTEVINIQRSDNEYFVLLSLPTVFPKATSSRTKHSKILELLKNSKSNSTRAIVSCYINSIEEMVQSDSNGNSLL